MTTEKYNRLKVTTKKGLIFEIILADWLKEGDHEFGKVEMIEPLSAEQGNDYIYTIENLLKMCDDDDE